MTKMGAIYCYILNSFSEKCCDWRKIHYFWLDHKNWPKFIDKFWLRKCRLIMQTELPLGLLFYDAFMLYFKMSVIIRWVKLCKCQYHIFSIMFFFHKILYFYFTFILIIKLLVLIEAGLICLINLTVILTV